MSADEGRDARTETSCEAEGRRLADRAATVYGFTTGMVNHAWRHACRAQADSNGLTAESGLGRGLYEIAVVRTEREATWDRDGMYILTRPRAALHALLDLRGIPVPWLEQLHEVFGEESARRRIEQRLAEPGMELVRSPLAATGGAGESTVHDQHLIALLPARRKA